MVCHRFCRDNKRDSGDRKSNLQAMYDRLVNQFVVRERITEQLKAENQILWIQRMNNIRNRATGIVNAELIYT